MTCRDIYGFSLSILGEDTSGDYSEDYEKRTPYLIAFLYSLLAEEDDALREARGLGTHGDIDMEKAELGEEFALCREFIPACAYYVASMLIFESDAKRADKLFDKYLDIVDKAKQGIPFEPKKTVDKYPI